MIVIEALNKHFKSGESLAQILHDINLRIDAGECVVLKGVSGSGKTTLLSIIAGMDRPSSGKVLVEGEPISKLPDLHISHFRAQKIGMIFQHFNLFEHLTAFENVMISLVPVGLKMEEVSQRVASSLKLANISHKAQSPAGRLSGGEKQRVAIARALASDPDIILCDEPTANLDRVNSLKFIEILSELHDMGKTIIVATHDPLFDALSFASRVVPIEDGSLVDDLSGDSSVGC
ncbi:MAG TPA: ABC transporter ATP-binding protein [Epsilonproteobacteria bacterium]|nr:ABC transporter ATP-binding protein [Campylobacterota bacterium]